MSYRNDEFFKSIKNKIKLDPSDAIAKIENEKLLGFIKNKDRLLFLEKIAKSNLYKEFLNSYKKKDYQKALFYLSDLKQVKSPHYSKKKKIDILLQIILKNYKNKILDYHYVKELLKEDNTIKNKQIESIKHYFQIKDFDPAKAIEGTLTVIVDSGNTLKDHMIVPDITLGSGFFISSNGYILTNHHVISAMLDNSRLSKLYVKSKYTKSRVEAKLISYDPIIDIALIKAPIRSKVFFSLSDKQVKEGVNIYAIGSPLGLEYSVSKGIVSSIARKNQIGYAYQIDAPINHGNSGGPVFDDNGNLIAVAFAGLEKFEGLNFAIPSYLIEKIIPQLFEKTKGIHKVSHPFLGLVLHDDLKNIRILYKHPKNYLDIKTNTKLDYVSYKKINDIKDVENLVQSYKPGNLISLSLNGKTFVTKLQTMMDCNLCKPFSSFNQDAFLVFFGILTKKIGKNKYIIDSILKNSIAEDFNLVQNDTFVLRLYELNESKKYIRIIIVSKNKLSTYFPKPMQLLSPLILDNLV